LIKEQGMKQFSILIFLVLLLSCQFKDKDSKTTNEDDIEIQQKNISDLTFMDIFKLLYSNESRGIDFHGSPFGQEAITDLKLIEAPDSCGMALSLTNLNKSKGIDLAVETAFNFPGNPNKNIVRAYKILPNASIPIGNSMLCYQNQQYIISRKILSAGFVSDE
jgi:hypothetical protein